MLRLLGLTAGWAAATAVVIALGWAAVGAVTGAVTDPPVLAQPPVRDAEPDPPASSRQDRATTRTFDLAGGRVGVRAGSSAVELVFATPNEGFSVDVRSRGPARVDVRFSSDDHESRFRYEPGAGERVEERPD